MGHAVEKDRSGTSYIAIDYHSPNFIDVRMIAVSVERIEPPWFYDHPGKVIRHSKDLPAEKFGLELKEKAGKILTHL